VQEDLSSANGVPAGKPLARYDAFKHLCRALNLSRKSLVLMLTAYLDVSRGSEPVYVLAGYVASVGQWERFRPKWKRLLSDYRTSVFAPADLDLKDAHGERIGTYRGWSDMKAAAFQRRAFEIIKSYRRVAVSSSILVNDYRIKFGWMREEEGLSRLYYHTTIDTLANVSKWIKRYRVKEPIQYIFETGHEGYDEVRAALEYIQKDAGLRALHNMETFTRAQKKSVVQLQAAGIWAYECYKHVANQRVRSDRIPVRESWKVLFRKYDYDYNTCWDKQHLDGLVALYKDLGGKWGQSVLA
jgi:hypothetical protein